MSHRHHYEVWINTGTKADVIGDCDTLRGALALYLRGRRKHHGGRISLLVDDVLRPQSVRPTHPVSGD